MTFFLREVDYLSWHFFNKNLHPSYSLKIGEKNRFFWFLDFCLDLGAAANIGWGNEDWGEPSNAANWFDNVGQVQQNIVQAQPEQAVAEPVQDIAEIQRALEDKEAECIALAAEVEVLVTTRQSLEAKIDELNQIVKSQAENQNDTKIEALEHQVEDLQDKLRESEHLVKALQSVKSDVSQEIAKLQNELETQKSQNQPTLSGQEANIGWGSNDEWGESSSAGNWFDNIGQTQQNLVQTPAEPAANIVDIQNALVFKEAECAALSAEVESLDKVRQTLQAKIDELNRNTNAIQENMSELESISLVKSQQEQTLADNTIKIEALEEQIKDLQNRLSQSEQGQTQSADATSTPFMDIPG